MARGIKSLCRRRNLLHRNKLELFRSWLLANGYVELPIPPTSIYEALRVGKVLGPNTDGPPIIIYERDGHQHLTVQENAVRLVHEFLRSDMNDSVINQRRLNRTRPEGSSGGQAPTRPAPIIYGSDVSHE